MNLRLLTLGALAAIVVSCGGEIVARRIDDVDQNALPDGVRADYQVFAQRCSKCHSLSRPLSSGIDSDEYWAMYVERMRRQPSSGISREDTVPILRFLHYFVVQQTEAKQRRLHPDAPLEASPGVAPTASPAASVHVSAEGGI